MTKPQTFIITVNHNGMTFYLIRDGKNDFWSLDKINVTKYSNKAAAECGREATKEFMIDKLDIWVKSRVEVG